MSRTSATSAASCWLRLAVAAVVLSSLSACRAHTPPISAISLSFPAGERSLVLQRDEVPLLYYGALATFAPVRGGSFDIDEIWHRLRPNLHPNVPAEERERGKSWGIVQLRFEDGTESTHLTYDDTLATSLLDAACAEAEFEDSRSGQVLAAACASTSPSPAAQP